MDRSQTYKSRSRTGSTTTRVVGSKLNKVVLGVIAILLLALVGWIGWTAWQGTSGVDSRVVDAAVRAGELASKESASQPEAVPVAAIGAKVGEIAPDFTIPTLAGDSFTLVEGRGKPTIMLFMAYWCGTCLGEARALTQLHQEYGDRVNIVSIDVDPSSAPEKLAQFKQAAGDGDFTWAFDAGQKVTAAYQVISLDTTLIIDGQGRVVYRDQFPTPYQPLKDELVKLGGV